MFGFFKKKADSRKTQGKLGTGGPIMSVLLLEGESFPVDGFLKQVARTRVAGKAVSGIDRGDGDVFSFEVDDEVFALALMPVPYPALEGPVLEHGQTIGMTADQQIHIQHCPSRFGHRGTVIRLEP